MSKRDLPQAEIASRPGLRSGVTPAALMRWNPDVNAASDSEASISILDVIGQDWMGEGVTAKRVGAALRSIGKKDVVVNINSPGGDFFEGLAIYNTLRAHPAKVTVKILGIAASAASVIAMSGDEIQIGRAGFMMIHNTWVVAMGDRNVFRDIADWLEPFDQSAVDLYAARSGMEPKEIAKMLDRETWLSGSEAIEKGFADALLPADEVEPKEKSSATQRQMSPAVAARKIEKILADHGLKREERLDLVMAMKGGPREAAATGLREATVVDEVHKLLAFARSL